MRDDYDFSNGIKNPCADKLKKQITIRLDDEVINYYLKDCVKEKRHLEVAFPKQGSDTPRFNQTLWTSRQT